MTELSIKKASSNKEMLNFYKSLIIITHPVTNPHNPTTGTLPCGKQTGLILLVNVTGELSLISAISLAIVLLE
jgi:hypothetical protein